MCARFGTNLGGERPLHTRSGEVLAEDKGSVARQNLKKVRTAKRHAEEYKSTHLRQFIESQTPVDSNRRVRNRTHGGVRGWGGCPAPALPPLLETMYVPGVSASRESENT